MKHINTTIRGTYLLAFIGLLIISLAFYNSRSEGNQYFILQVIAAFLALTITLVGITLTAKHRNRFIPYLSLSFLCAGSIDFLSSVLSKGILFSLAASAVTFNYISHLLGQMILSVILGIGFTLAVKRPGTWSIATNFMNGALFLSFITMVFLTYMPFQDVIPGSGFGFYQLLSFIPTALCIYLVIFILKFKSKLLSKSESLIGRALIPCLLLLSLVQPLVSLSPFLNADVLFLGYFLKVLAYFLALFAMLGITENVLKENEQRMSRFFSASIEGLLFHEQGKIIDSNRAAADLFGCTISEVIGKNITEFLLKDNLSELQTALEKEFPITWDTELVRHDNLHIPVRILMRNIGFNGQTLSIAAIRDITEQKQAEKYLLLSESRLKEAQEVAHLGSWELDLVDNVLWWSDENYRIFGIEDKTKSNTYESFLNSIHPDDYSFVNKAYTDSVKNRTPYNIEHRLLMPDGSVKWVNERCITYYDDNTPLRSVGTVMDITERKHSQFALEKYNKLTSSILDIISSPVFVVDAEGRVVRFNRACEQLTGYLYANIKGEFIWSITRSLYDQEQLKQFYQTPNHNNFPNKRRVDWPTAKGDIRTIDWENTALVGDNDKIEHIISAGIDVTERLLSEKLLKKQLWKLDQKINERTQELETMLALSPDGFVMIDNKHQIIFANPAFLKMTGFHIEEVNSISMIELIRRVVNLCNAPEEIQPVDIDYFINHSTLHLKKPVQRDINCIQKDILDPNGTYNGIVLYFHDITHETELIRLKSEFLSSAAHEFRTPLSSILGFSDLLLSQEYNEANRRKFTEIINRQSKHLKNLLDELLDIQSIEARTDRDILMETGTPEEVIKLVIEDTQSFATEKHKLKMDFLEEWPLVTFNSEKLQQALVNIFSNAYKYSPEGGTITCSTLLKNKDKVIMLGIRVEDQGIGISGDDIRQLGKRFYRADKFGKIPGTGLGISLVNEIIALHNGELEITSKLAQGSTFTVWLPVVTNDT
jgi:PAS domain S-box-containing protein